MKLEQCRRAAGELLHLHLHHHHLQKQIQASPSSSSSSSFHTSKSPSKSTKWLPYKQTFASELAMESFKQSINKSNSTLLLSSLINSFSTYKIKPTSQSYHFLLSHLIQNRFFHHQIPPTLDHLEKVVNFETPECIFIDLINFYGNGSMFSEAVDLFFRMPKFRCQVTVESLNALLLVLCKDNIGIKLVPQVLRKSMVVEESSFRILVEALCGMGKPNAALQLLLCMTEDGLFTFADQNLLSLVLAAKCSESNASEGEIEGFMRDLRVVGFKPSKTDFCNVIRFLVVRGKGISALEVLREMKADGSLPDLMCYNLVLDGLFHEREFLRADKLFDEILVQGLVPDVHTYNVYIWGLCMQNKVDEGIDMIASMEVLACMPNLNTYVSILIALCEDRKIWRVRKLMDSMRRRLIRMNLAAYEIMVDRLVSRGHIKVARGLVNEMLGNKFVPMPTALDKIICWSCNNGLHFEAVELLKGVTADGIAPGDKAWEALIQGLGTTFNLETFVDLAKF